MAADPQRVPLQYERKLALSFGAVVLLLIVLAAGAAVFLFQRSQALEENRLCSTISAIVSESISRESFSGKNNMRQLTQILLTQAPELEYLSVETLQGRVWVHSDPTRDGTAVDAQSAELSRRSLESGGPVLAERTWAGVVVKEAVAPYHGDYGNQVVGVVRVGVRVDVTREEQRRNLLMLLVLVAGLTLAAMTVVFRLSRFFGGTATSLAKQLRGILDNAPLPIAITDDKGQVMASSAAFDSLLGRTKAAGLETASTAQAAGALSDEGRRLLREADAAEMGPEQRVERELCLPSSQGDHYWHYTRFPVSVDPAGIVRQHCVILRDITGSRRAEAKIQVILQRLSAITATVPVVLYEVTGADSDFGLTRFTYMSEKVRDLLGVSAEDVVADPNALFRLVQPEDWAGLMVANSEALSGGREFFHEFRVVLAGGQLKWLRVCSMPSRVENGVPAWIGYMMDITVTKLGEIALVESEKKYRAIFENTPVGIFRSTFSGRLLEANPTFATMLGYETQAALIASVTDVGADLYYESAAKTRLREALLVNPGGTPVEVEFKRRDGSRFYAIITASLQFDAQGEPTILNGTIEDINERKRAEKLLRQSEEKFSRLFLLSPDSIALTDLGSGKYIDVNNAFTQATGFTREEVLGHTCEDLGLFANAAEYEKFLAVTQRDGRVENYEVESRYKDGTLAICSISSQVVKIGEESFRLSIVRDITSTRRMQEMMIQTEKMLSVGGIAAGIAHEINNPLGIVLQAAQNLVQRTRGDFQKNVETAASLGLDMELLQRYMQARKLDVFIQDIQSAAVRASAIIRHMLDFSRSSESRRKVCDIASVIDKAIALASNDYDLKKNFDFKRVTIEREYGQNLPEVSCTEMEIEQVILNLLRNSAQAMAMCQPPVAAPTIGIRLQAHDGMLRIELSDNGPGIPPEVRRRVFEPFYTTKPPGVGTGLGLSVSFFIITKGHGGMLSVESQPGNGTVFTIMLPAEEAKKA